VTSTFVGVREASAAGHAGRVHALACDGGAPGDRTACGLPARTSPGAPTAWNAVLSDERCARCADAVLTVRLRALQPSPRLLGMEWWQL
jgi:hypothetical protein